VVNFYLLEPVKNIENMPIYPKKGNIVFVISHNIYYKYTDKNYWEPMYACAKQACDYILPPPLNTELGKLFYL